MPRQTPRYHFDLRKQREANGSTFYSFFVAGKHIPLRSRRNGSAFWLVDLIRTMPNEIESSGLKARVKLVLKIYCKIPQKALVKHRERKRYERLLRGIPGQLELTS